MFSVFKKQNKSTLREKFYARKDRVILEGKVYIRRSGYPTIHGCQGNISADGLYVELINHDLVKGTKVEITHETKESTIKYVTRMSGIVIRVDQFGVAFVTYKKIELQVS